MDERRVWGVYALLEGVAGLGGFVTVIISCAQIAQYGADGLRLGLVVIGAFLAAGGSTAVLYALMQRWRVERHRERAIARAARASGRPASILRTSSVSVSTLSSSWHSHA